MHEFEGVAAGDDAALRYQSGKMGELLKSEPGALDRTAADITRETITPTTAGMGVGVEASVYPHQHNRSNAPIGSKERGEAETWLPGCGRRRRRVVAGGRGEQEPTSQPRSNRRAGVLYAFRTCANRAAATEGQGGNGGG